MKNSVNGSPIDNAKQLRLFNKPTGSSPADIGGTRWPMGAPLIPMTRPHPTPVFDTYWKFAVERQRIFFRRIDGSRYPWTADPILSKFKFTNAYRASDRVSQYLIRHVIYQGSQEPTEVVFRILLFKLFNKIATWQLLSNTFGALEIKAFDVEQFSAVLTNAMERGERIYSAAYIMPSPNKEVGGRKHVGHLRLLQTMLRDDLPHKLVDAGSMADAFALLRSYRSIGDFLAYQFVTDINYSDVTSFSEQEFVIPGPGALNGLSKCFRDRGALSTADTIKYVMDRQHVEFAARGLEFKNLWGRELQLIDCQNLFCEVDKYARVRHPEAQGLNDRKKIKQVFVSQGAQDPPWYPPKWGINLPITNDANRVTTHE